MVNIKDLIKMYDMVQNGLYYKTDSKIIKVVEGVKINKYGLEFELDGRRYLLSPKTYGKFWARTEEEISD